MLELKEFEVYGDMSYTVSKHLTLSEMLELKEFSFYNFLRMLLSPSELCPLDGWEVRLLTIMRTSSETVLVTFMCKICGTLYISAIVTSSSLTASLFIT